ncbi:MAG: tRNA uridine-5-carboxymethylaminomethyl(34) synthesis enzyme MnmG [Ruminococcaceae bacterium]|nr:tRNA uridine-5-carboxymethylaminomethyl(34) synthesis enzyme MnmG [Oscillospiraceae bacterium]
MDYFAGSYDVAVVGAGHAGVEAALAAARLGAKTVIFTISLDGIANMPCNPSIGGTAKGHLVREIDALGGEMGKAADATFLQSRMLNLGKGPAVHSLRVQSDRAKYHLHMKKILENQPGLDVKQAEIVEVRTENGEVKSVVTALGAVYEVKTAIICTGTYLKGKIFVGECAYESGPDGTHAANRLSESLRKAGVELRRFKTGTPARVHKDSIDFTGLEIQEGDDPVVPLSFETTEELKNKMVCHITYTNERTHEIIRQNIGRSPLYGGKIEGIGPRYCPSIEDKVMRFPDKQRHQIFIEPMGEDTNEMYLQGMSSSLPEEVQIAFYKTIKGLENVKMMRNAYAIEYDCCDPLQLNATLEFREISGLYGAGQFNGTSGYEEAAGQGLIAGINASRKVFGKEQIILPRESSYIGTLIDDLVVKGCLDPYRMMTSRSEYRLHLRQDNADLRLMHIGYEVGLINEERWNRFLDKKARVEQEIARLESTGIAPSAELSKLLEEKGTAAVANGALLADLIRRPQITYEDIAVFDTERPELTRAEKEQVEIQIKYSGYISKQLAQIKEQKRLSEKKLPKEINYKEITGLRLEAIEKLEKVRPENIGQASRISGVSPADIDVLLIYLRD